MVFDLFLPTDKTQGMSLVQYIFLFTSVFLGGLIAFFLRRGQQRFLQLILAFSGAYILGISVLHLLPEVYLEGSSNSGLWILLGFFIQLFLEQLSRGVEHGHMHALHSTQVSTAISVMVGLCLHALLEGIPLAGYEELHAGHHHHDHDHGHQFLLAGIILHKIPAAFALSSLLLISGFTRRFTILCLVFFSLMSPLGALIGNVLPLNHELHLIFLSLVIGSFLHISTTILFESDNSNHHRISMAKLAMIIVGTLLAWGTTLL